MIDVTEEDKQRIVLMKKQNPFMSTTKISETFGVSDTTINTILRNNNCTTFELTGLRNRKYGVDDNYFEKIDSHTKAYILGVFYSDGYLVIEGKGTKRIGLDVADVEWLQGISDELKSEAPLYKTAKQHIKRLKISSPKMYEDLIKLGCVPNKSLTVKFPTEEQVPKEFLSSFILGLIDGDGSIGIYKRKVKNKYYYTEYRVTLTKTKELLEGVQKFLGVEHLKLSQRFPERGKNNYTLTISGINNVAEALKKIYANAPDICLKRKYENYQFIMNDSRVRS